MRTLNSIISLTQFDDLNTSQRYDLLNDIYHDLFNDLMDFADLSKKMNIFNEQKKKLIDAIDVIFNLKKEN